MYAASIFRFEDPKPASPICQSCLTGGVDGGGPMRWPRTGDGYMNIVPLDWATPGFFCLSSPQNCPKIGKISLQNGKFFSKFLILSRNP